MQPWLLVLLGLALALGSLAPIYGDSDGGALARLALVNLGLLFAGAGVCSRLRGLGEELDERVQGACVVLVAALVALVAWLAFDESWDSGRMITAVLAVVGLFGAALVLMPRPARRLVASFLILFHFGGIFCAVASVDPGGAPPPWLAMQAWAHVYRPYLGFLYLNNAYHFYSPEPGPPNLLWAHIEYRSNQPRWYRSAHGQPRWVKLPAHGQSGSPMHYQRLLSITEQVNVLKPPVMDQNVAFAEARRKKAGEILDIPMHPDPRARQYAEPQDYAKVLISAYARHMATCFPNPDDPDDEVVRVKLYRVTHLIVEPARLVRGQSPLDKSLYLPYFLGEFDSEGRLINPQDPFLYWLLPILQDPGSPSGYLDCLEKHAALRLNEEAPRK
jgi:hypothetical protein